MTIVALREAPVVLVAASYTAVPFPTPVAPLVIVIQGWLLVAVQVQPAAIVTGKAMENPALFGTTVGLPTDPLHGMPA